MTTPEKILHPLYGSHCRTQLFSRRPGADKEAAQVHAEAYLDDPVKKTWTVCEVTETATHSFHRLNEGSKSTSLKLKSGVTFREAVEALAVYERDKLNNSSSYGKLYPEAPYMGYSHYKAFAEREGYVFDKQGKPHARPYPDILPPDFEFDADDIKSANRHLLRPVEEFNNNGTLGKAPSAYFIFDGIKRAAQRRATVDDADLLEKRVLNVIDLMTAALDSACRDMEDYCGSYQQPFASARIHTALASLDRADASVRQLKAYGISADDFCNFIDQTKVVCHVLHAQGVYDLMRKGGGNAELFKTKVKDAAEALDKIDPTDEADALLQEMIARGGAPEMPPTIRAFVNTLKQKRLEYPILPPKQPAPPTASSQPKPPSI